MLAPTVLGVQNAIEMMPAHLVERSERERAEYGYHFRISQGLRFLSYQKLGLSQYHDALTAVRCDLLLLNEAHKTKNPRAACTRRIRRFVREHPTVPVVAVSGTLLSNSLLDFGPLVRQSLKDNSAVPVSDSELKIWADALDEKPGGWQARDPGALLTLCNAEETALARTGDVVTAARRAFCRRLAETPGVVSIGSEDVATADGDPVRIVVRGLEYTQDPIVEQHFETLRRRWETPNGWQFSQAMEVWAHARELAVGVHYEWTERPPEWVSAASPGPWMNARRSWCSYVRETLKHDHRFDSEAMVATACAAGVLDSPEYREWMGIRDTFAPESRMVWHCDGALRAAEAWAQGGPGVIWTHHSKFARELSRRTGLRYFGRKGLDANGIAIDTKDPAERAVLDQSVVIASMQANATGRNIQGWHRGLVTAAPHNAKDWEQLIGRFHRKGQLRDTVELDVLVGCVEHSTGWQRSLDLARMTRDLLGAPQKLLIAEVSGFPDVSQRPGWKWQVTQDERAQKTDVLCI